MAEEKSFDCVRMMREIRDWVNREIEGMTFEEQQRWMQEQLTKKEEPQAPATLHEKAG